MWKISSTAIVLCVALNGWADKWDVRFSESDSVAIAYTSNQESNIFGLYCVESLCYYVVIVGNECEVGSEYPILASSSAGAASMKVFCWRHLDEKYLYAFTDFDQADTLARAASSVAFAIPVSNNKFRVERFDLRNNISYLDRLVAFVRKKYKNATFGYEL